MNIAPYMFMFLMMAVKAFSRCFFENGELKEVQLRKLSGIEPLPQKQVKDAQKVIEVYAEEIVDRWTDFFVRNKKIKSKRITKKL